MRKLFKFSLHNRKINAEVIRDFQGFESSKQNSFRGKYSRKYCTLDFIIASQLFFLSLVLQTYAVPLLMQKLQCVAWQKRKTLCVCLSSPTALTLQNRTRQSLPSKKVTFKKLRAFYSLMRQLNFFLAVQLGVCSWHFNLSMYYRCHKIV